jgi:hypothetical protein
MTRKVVTISFEVESRLDGDAGEEAVESFVMGWEWFSPQFDPTKTSVDTGTIYVENIEDAEE